MGISDITSSMKTAAIVLALALGVSCDTLGGHSHGHGHGLRQGRQEEALGAYGQPQYGDDLDTAASDASDPLAMLQSAVPGVPGEDYPIYAEVPETALPVMDKSMEVTMLMVRLNVKCSTFVLLMELEVLPSTVSCVPMEPSSTRTTSSVTGVQLRLC